MNYLVRIIMLVLLPQIAVYGADATEKGKHQLMLETKIYLLKNDSSATKVLEASPTIIALAGKEASIQIGIGDEPDVEGKKIVMNFLPNEDATLFDVKLSLLNGEDTMISHIEDAAIDKPLNLSAKFNDVTRIFSVKATRIDKLYPGQDQDHPTTDAIASEQACGRVSVFTQPPLNERYYPATIFNINDKNVLTGKKTFQLTPGKHTVYLFNHDGNLSSTSNSERYKGRGKGVVIEIKPNMTYHLGAKFESEKRYNKRDQENWTPVVWKITEEACSL